jgi:hypothetical protein
MNRIGRGASVVSVVTVLLAVPVSAQQQIAEASDIERSRMQVKNFEMALRNAVEAGAAALAEEVQKRYPGEQIAWSSDPVVRGWYQPHFGYNFAVEVPGILPISLIVLRSRPLPPTAAPTPANVERPRGAPDVTGLAAAPWDPEKAYGEKVRTALIESLLESSKSLPFKASEWVSITGIVAPAPYPVSAFIETRRRILTLQIRGADLSAYHRGEIAKNDAIGRIVESRF